MRECARTACSVRLSAASVASDHKPRQPGVMRPSDSTAVASITSSAAPDSARWPRCTVCHSVAAPSTALYWHIGAMTMRF